MFSPLTSTSDLRKRIYQWVLLIGGINLVFFVVPTDIFEHLPWRLTAGMFLFGLFMFGMVYLARAKDLYFYRTVGILNLLLLNFAWIFNCGSQGPVPLVLSSATVLLCVLFAGAERWVFLFVLALNLSGLYYLEYLYPHLVTSYHDPLQRLLDTTISIPFLILVCGLMVQAVLRAYESEQRRLEKAYVRLEDTNARLDASRAKVRVLTGLLPVCAGCKKIRTQEEQWIPIEEYITEHSQASFTHGLCPECLLIYLPPTHPRGEE